ncbi:hypothetical protein GN926_000618 [Neisseria gonorrhoeae]|nr:hypothetical protein [Neisseria gonorrhoeae]
MPSESLSDGILFGLENTYRNPKKAKSNPTDRVFVCTEIMQ